MLNFDKLYKLIVESGYTPFRFVDGAGNGHLAFRGYTYLGETMNFTLATLLWEARDKVSFDEFWTILSTFHPDRQPETDNWYWVSGFAFPEEKLYVKDSGGCSSLGEELPTAPEEG